MAEVPADCRLAYICLHTHTYYVVHWNLRRPRLHGYIYMGWCRRPSSPGGPVVAALATPVEGPGPSHSPAGDPGCRARAAHMHRRRFNRRPHLSLSAALRHRWTSSSPQLLSGAGLEGVVYVRASNYLLASHRSASHEGSRLGSWPGRCRPRPEALYKAIYIWMPCANLSEAQGSTPMTRSLSLHHMCAPSLVFAKVPAIKLIGGQFLLPGRVCHCCVATVQSCYSHLRPAAGVTVHDVINVYMYACVNQSHDMQVNQLPWVNIRMATLKTHV